MCSPAQSGKNNDFTCYTDESLKKLRDKWNERHQDDIIEDVEFKTYGCGSAIGSSSELVEMIIGKTLEEAKAIKNIEIVEALELPPIKIHCSVLAEDSIKQAIEDYEAKQ